MNSTILIFDHTTHFGACWFDSLYYSYILTNYFQCLNVPKIKEIVKTKSVPSDVEDICGINLHSIVIKYGVIFNWNWKFTLSTKIYRQINSLAILSSVKTVVFTKFLVKMTTDHRVQWKNEKFPHWNFFRQINYLVISLVKPLLSRNFCGKSVRENFYTVRILSQRSLEHWNLLSP